MDNNNCICVIFLFKDVVFDCEDLNVLKLVYKKFLDFDEIIIIEMFFIIV